MNNEHETNDRYCDSCLENDHASAAHEATWLVTNADDLDDQWGYCDDALDGTEFTTAIIINRIAR